ncbi:tetratricopeptide repeat protein [Desulfovibrio litoralis]|uniref:CCHC-type domain-containing protein n=1 Tax=Desulfovibrio litoralis DSM 11393 TaxID=1121455 RepID=A0A1M7SR22_9BACT|nr:tetratricopeptide repeat protein [Desulfovibrio litoralis]SHN61013.1 hypothetical protein SAMN02745728_01180 [Desulfovibrio litoralis DSM 11393]
MKLSELIANLPKVKEPQINAQGYIVWAVWTGEPSNVVEQTITDYGGLSISTAENQGLWFFFSSDVFLAAGRLDSWAKFNKLNYTLVILPSTLLVGNERLFEIELSPEFLSLDIKAPTEFKIFTHPTAREHGGTPGLKFNQITTPEGFPSDEWTEIEADPRLQYKASLGWYCLLRPLGNPLDKAFQTGWRDFFSQIESILQRNKFRYTVHEYFLLIPLETLKNFQTWCKDYLALVKKLKDNMENPVDEPSHYWPCVIAVVDRKGLNFSNDLPQKVNIDWDQLMPDHPITTSRNGLLLGKDFNLHSVRLSNIDDNQSWCSVSLLEEGEKSSGILANLVPIKLVSGKQNHCFYCGQRGHATTECPSKQLKDLEPDLWRKIAFTDFSVLKQTVSKIEDGIGSQTPKEVLTNLLTTHGNQGLLIHGMFDINVAVQQRMLQRMFLTRGKEYPKGLEDYGARDENPIWKLVDSLPSGDLIPIDKELTTLINRYPRDYRPRSLQGFVAMEREDYQRAQTMWREAETYSASPMLQAWHKFLEGRLHEIQGRFHQAIALYDEVLRISPLWLDASYRKIICQVKTGFAEQAFSALIKLMDKDANYFNKTLLDPEMERGHIIMLTGLYTAWKNAETKMIEETKNMDRIKNELSGWFPENTPFALKIIDRIDSLKKLSEKHNYVPYQSVIQGRSAIERDMQLHINAEGRSFKTKFKNLMERLMIIRDETSWLPFSSSFMEFNKTYNQCAINLNWAIKANFQVADPFRKAQILITQEEERLTNLESRLKLLRIIRDVTLFLLTTGKTFLIMWLPLMFLIVAGIPLGIFYVGENPSMMNNTLLKFLSDNRFEVQKSIIIISTMLCFSISALRTTFSFEKIKNRVFSTAKEEQIAKQKRRKELLNKMMQQEQVKRDSKGRIIPDTSKIAKEAVIKSQMKKKI